MYQYICSLCSHHLSPDVKSPSIATLATLSLTSSTTLMPFPSSSPSPSPRRVEQSRTSPWHHKTSNKQLELRLSHLPLRPFETPPPSPPPSSFQYLPANKVLTGKQLQNRPFQDFSTGLLVMPCNQLGKKVTSRSRPYSRCSHPVNGRPPRWQYQY